MAAVRTIICLIVALLGFAPAKTSAAVRVYFIAADEVAWDYAPSYPNNPITGEPFTTDESVYLREAKERIGRKYLKTIYREYTDASFLTLKSQGPREGSLGILGPIIHVEVGDLSFLDLCPPSYCHRQARQSHSHRRYKLAIAWLRYL
jgi:manganese oxidase